MPLLCFAFGLMENFKSTQRQRNMNPMGLSPAPTSVSFDPSMGQSCAFTLPPTPLCFGAHLRHPVISSISSLMCTCKRQWNHNSCWKASCSSVSSCPSLGVCIMVLMVECGSQFLFTLHLDQVACVTCFSGSFRTGSQHGVELGRSP